MSSGSKKRSLDMLSFSLKEFRQENPLQIPQRVPYGRNTRLQGVYSSHLIYLFLSFPQSPR